METIEPPVEAAQGDHGVMAFTIVVGHLRAHHRGGPRIAGGRSLGGRMAYRTARRWLKELP